MQLLARNDRRPEASRSGFTLIELLAVLLILSILFAFLVTNVFSAGERVRTGNTRAFLSQISAAVASYENDKGDYPPSQHPAQGDRGNNKTNMGIEELVISLFPPGGGGADLPDDRFVNTDLDSSRASQTDFPESDLFELRDDWDNPIAYLHSRDYESGPTYVTFDPETGELLEGRVLARKNPTTGAFHNRRSFQLLSAGPDGVFGTEDDIGNFDE